MTVFVRESSVALVDMNCPYSGTGMGRCQSNDVCAGPLQLAGVAVSFLDG